MPSFTSPRLQQLWTLVAMRDDASDLSHDLDHVYRVTAWTVRLARDRGLDEELACAAGLVHDLVNIPKESAQRPLGSELSAVAGAELLEQVGFSGEQVAQVVEAVRTCSWSRGLAPTSALGEVLQDADRLDAIGAIGIARNFACAQAMNARGAGGRLFNPEDPDAQSRRELDDVRFAADHYRRKLLKLAATMHSRMARKEALRRHNFMERFLEELRHEGLAARMPEPSSSS